MFPHPPRIFIPGPTQDLGTTDGTTLNSVAVSLQSLALLHMTSLGALATGEPTSGLTPKIPEYLSVKKPWIDEPDGSQSFDKQNGTALPPAGIGPGSSATVLQFTVPDGFDGVIKWFAWNFTGGGFIQFSGDIVVQLFRNNAAVQNYDNILNEKGTLQFPRPISPIRIFANQIITLRVSHPSNVTLNGDVVGTLSGYFYPNRG